MLNKYFFNELEYLFNEQFLIKKILFEFFYVQREIQNKILFSYKNNNSLRLLDIETQQEKEILSDIGITKLLFYEDKIIIINLKTNLEFLGSQFLGYYLVIINKYNFTREYTSNMLSFDDVYDFRQCSNNLFFIDGVLYGNPHKLYFCYDNKLFYRTVNNPEVLVPYYTSPSNNEIYKVWICKNCNNKARNKCFTVYNYISKKYFHICSKFIYCNEINDVVLLDVL